jgi:hypothetical protein
MRSIDARVEHAITARSRPDRRLEADCPLRIAELQRRVLDPSGALHKAELWRRETLLLQASIALGLVV